jgi:pimeloyl-ACP methyl ester carboxylesterase
MPQALSRVRFGSPNASRAPIVVLPGLGVSRYLRAACERLAGQSQREVLLVDPPGFGSNAHVLDEVPTVSSVEDCLRSWLSTFGPALLVGQSTGCLLAARLARSSIGLDIRALALAGPVFDPASATLRRAGTRLLQDSREEPWWLGLSEAPEWLRNARALPGYLRSCLVESLLAHLNAVACPVVVTRGDRDPLSRHEWAARLAEGPGRTLVTVPGGSHTYMAGRPGLLAESLDVGRFGEGVAL